ncbi:hypothetical protein BLNAU_24620 [Blattamonas nauphoetae]|uniref:Uncharacterized protein n=1 Tax=Blattamonas nauphoetae TaxID=2049346 RepID=A0ABQ9WR13_9EUKA|nr:hypothetical protein BLNAU_24620 [Blattamonas nauphoetae]
MSALNTNPDAPLILLALGENIHICLTRIIIDSFWLATPNCLQQLEIEDPLTSKLFTRLPIIPTIPSCLAFIEQDESIWELLEDMLGTQREWNTTRGEERQMWKTVHRMLRMEGIEDVIEEKLQNDRNGYFGEYPVAFSITLNNLQGMNLPFLW